MWVHRLIPVMLMGGFCFVAPIHAQICPPNIDFENGTFDGWTCYTGYVGHVNGQNQMYLTPSYLPVPDRHTMIPRTAEQVYDEYGGFPVNCPNGSGYSVRLGNNRGGTEAEGLSYEFTIPEGQNTYSIIYHYAVVFEEPDHEEYEQPRLEIEVRNVTDNKVIHCSSFTFIPYGSILPGFQQSSNYASNAAVWYKDWSAVSINLNNQAGKRIRMFFKTADCTFRRHFGYAYIDVNSECSSEFTGAAFCPNDTALTLKAPFGYEKYTWFNSDFSRAISHDQAINFSPIPAAGTVFPVKVVPYDGYGCVDTFYARLADTLTVRAVAGPDTLSCNFEPVPLGQIPRPGLTYSWSPARGLSNPHIANPFAAPDRDTRYVLTTSSEGGGCVVTDTVLVRTSQILSTMVLEGTDRFCRDSPDSAVLLVPPLHEIKWFRNNRLVGLESSPRYRVTETGVYHARLVNSDGCVAETHPIEVVIDDPRPGERYPIQYAVEGYPLPLEARRFGENVRWNPGHWLDNPESVSPKFNGSAEQLYTIEIRTRGNCLTVDTQMVKLMPRVEIRVPNAFTPNGDGRNDYLRPVLMGIRELRYFRVFNRQGSLIYEMRSDQKGWDGTINGHPQPAQTVVWALEGIGHDGQVHRQKGTAVLVR